MPRKFEKLSKPKLLIGEGIDEQEFFEALIEELKIDNIQVEQYQGKTNLKRFLKSIKADSNFSQLISLGITRDADASAVSAFQSVRDTLRSLDFPVPNTMGEIVEDALSISVFIIPDNSSSGMLEDICLRAFESDPIWQCIDNYFNCLKNQVNKEPKNLSKARIHAWLAAQEDPDKRLGQAAKSNYLPWDSLAFGKLKKFLQNL